MEWRDCGSHLEPITPNCSTSNKLLVNFISPLNCSKINKCKNFRNRLLNLFITNIKDYSSARAPIPFVKPDENHPPFFGLLAIDSNISFIKSKPRIEYIYKRGNYEGLNKDLHMLNWDELFLDCDAETATCVFYEKIYDLIKSHIPTEIIKSSQYPKWFS